VSDGEVADMLTTGIKKQPNHARESLVELNELRFTIHCNSRRPYAPPGTGNHFGRSSHPIDVKTAMRVESNHDDSPMAGVFKKDGAAGKISQSCVNVGADTLSTTSDPQPERTQQPATIFSQFGGNKSTGEKQ